MAIAEILRFAGDASAAAELKRELVVVGRAHPNVIHRGIAIERSTAATLSDLSYLDVEAGRLDEARAHAEDALAIRRELGLPHGIAHALLAVANVAYSERDFGRARELFAESAGVAAAAGAVGDLAEARIGEAECELLSRSGDAEGPLREGLEALRSLGDQSLELQGLRVAAMFAAARGLGEQAAFLFGAKEARLQEVGLALFGALEAEVESSFVRRARRDFGDAAYDAVYERGFEASAEVDPEVLLAGIRGDA